MTRMFRDHAHHVDWHHIWARQEARASLADAWWTLAGGRRGARLLDVGSGPGFFALRYAAHGAEVTAVDLAPEAIAFLDARRGPEHETMRAFVHDAERTPVPGGPFDAALVTHVLHHAEAPGALLANLRGVARRLVLAEFDPRGPGDVGPPREARLAVAEARALVEAAGWRVERVVEGQDAETYTIVAA